MLALQPSSSHNNPMNNNSNGQSSRPNRFNSRNRGGNNPNDNTSYKKNIFQRSDTKNFAKSNTSKSSTTTDPLNRDSKPLKSTSVLSANVSQFQEELEFDSLIGGFAINQTLFQPYDIPIRQLPKFLVYQPPNLKAPPLQQDEWDASNQAKMLDIEEKTPELALLYDDFCKLREIERTTMQARGLVDNEEVRKTLEDAISFTGSCFDMCPVFERVRRATENDVTKYEKDPITGRVLRSRAIKAFSRPAAGQPPPLPSDVRPPLILVQTLNYIIENLLTELPEAQTFIWDRTRSIRQDFTYQNYIGPEAIECTEKIVRIHILTLHIMAKSDVEYSQQQELEQMNKAFKTLSEMYSEFNSRGLSAPNEAEFKSYYLLSQLRDPELDREIQTLPLSILHDPLIQMALNLRNLVQSNIVKRGFVNSENTLNLYKIFFDNLREVKLPTLFAYLLEIHLNEIRFYAMKALKKSLGKNAKPYPMSYIIHLLAFNDEQDMRLFMDYYGVNVTLDGVDMISLNHSSHLIPDSKPLKQAFVLKYDPLVTSFKELVDSGFSNLHIDVGDIPEFKSKSIAKPAFSFGSQPEPFVSTFGSNYSNPSFGEIVQPINNGVIPSTSGFSFSSEPKVEDLEKIQREKEAARLKAQKLEEDQRKKKKEQEEELERRRKEKEEEELKKKKKQQEEIQKLEQMKQKLLMEKQKRQDKIQLISEKISTSIYENMISTILTQETTQIIAPFLRKRQLKHDLLETYSQGLLEAFVNEIIYINILEIKAERFYNMNLKSKLIKKIKKISDEIIEREQTKKRKYQEFIQVSKNFGIPLSSIKRKKSKEFDKKIDLNFFKFDQLIKNLIDSFKKRKNFNMLIYNPTELNPTIGKLLNLKFPSIINDQTISLSISTITKQINQLTSLVDNQFIVINVENTFGTVDEFNLNYLVQGLRLNSDYKVEILVVIWDISHQYGKAHNIKEIIMKGFKSYLNDLIIQVKIVVIDSDLNLDLIEESLNEFGSKIQLTKKGEFNIQPQPNNNRKEITNHPNILESTAKKVQKFLHNERIFNHYRTHLESSPRHKKLPTLRSSIYKDTPIPSKEISLVKKQPYIEHFVTPRPKSSSTLLQTPSFFNDTSATISTFANITFDHHIKTPVIKTYDHGDIRMKDVEEEEEEENTDQDFVKKEVYQKNLEELKKLTRLIKSKKTSLKDQK